MNKARRKQDSKFRTAAISGRRLFLSLALCVTLALLTACQAAAFVTHRELPFSPISEFKVTDFGPPVGFEVVGGLAIEEATGNVFLNEPRGAGEIGVVDIFGEEGGVPTGLTPPYQLVGLATVSPEFSGVAFDNSPSSAAQGTLYVSEQAPKRVVRKFTRVGATEKYEASGELAAKTPAFTTPAGVAVDQQGNVFVAEANEAKRSIVKFSPSGVQLGRISLEGLNLGNNIYSPRSIAVDGAGDVFVVVIRSGNPGNPKTRVIKYPANAFGEIDQSVFEEVFASDADESGDAAAGIAVDLVENALYVAVSSFGDPDRILQYDATNLALEGEFGADELTAEEMAGPIRLAVDSSSGHVYVAEEGFDKQQSKFVHRVSAFGPAVQLPTVRAEAPTNVIGSKATLRGVINPEGIAIDECKFEYGPTPAYGTSVPCEEGIPADDQDHPVSAKITGLTPNGALYHFRVVGTNENGSGEDSGTFLSGPPAVTEPATDVTGATATLNGVVLPQSQAVTLCRFEYLTEADFNANGEDYEGDKAPLTQSCAEPVPADDDEHAVSTAVDHLLANGTTYRFRLVVNIGGDLVEANSETLVTKTTYFTEPASPIGDTTATVRGKFNLEGVPLTACSFEYGLTDSYGSSVPCEPPFGSIPADSADHSVEASLTGLNQNATYHYRLVAENAVGVIPGQDMTLTTSGLPLIKEQFASPLGATEALLSGAIDTVGQEVSYHFEWGLDSSYGSRAPAGPDSIVGPGASPLPVSEALAGLTEGTTYHYRLVATSPSGTALGPDQAFTTGRVAGSCPNAAIRDEQDEESLIGSTYLPDCMALEMVSPPQKFNQKVTSPNFSLDGDAVQFLSIAALAGTPQLGSVLGDPYVATRTGMGWETHAVQPSPDVSEGEGGLAAPCGYSPDLQHWNLVGRPGAGTIAQGVVQGYSGNLGGSFAPLGSRLTPRNIPFGLAICERGDGSSSDAGRLFFRAAETAYLPGDPVPTGSQAFPNTYVAYLDEAGSPASALLNRDAGGTVYGGTCGSVVGWEGIGGRYANRGAISSDGSQVYFTARPSQGSGTCSNTKELRIFQRVETEAGPQITEPIAPECDRVSPVCDTTGGDDNFMAASLEGDKVFFTTNRQLVDSDLDAGGGCQGGASAGCDLYLFDASLPAGSRLIQVSAGDDSAATPGKGAEVLGLADVSGDGSHAYFVAKGLLTTQPNARGARAQAGSPNLYLYERDATHPDGRTAFIAALATGEGKAVEGAGRNGMAAVPLLGEDPSDLSTGGDGHILFFASAAPLVPGDGDGGKVDGYRYDAETGSLERITRAAPGGGDNGAFDVGDSFSSGKGQAPQNLFFGRTVSEDGRVAVFSTAEPLDPRDDDGRTNVYVWRDGDITAVQGSLAPSPGANVQDTFTVSLSGESIAFDSADQLLSTDRDGAKDVYVARVDGGFPVAPPPPICVGEDCQAPFAAQPPLAHPASESAAGANVSPKPAKCRKGFVRKHGKCVKKSRHGGKQKKKQKKRRANGDRRAGK